MGFIKNKYIGRTFISPTQAMRENEVNIKLNPIRSVVEGKRVVLIDDSIVRGTTCRRTIDLLREAGAKEIHYAGQRAPLRGRLLLRHRHRRPRTISSPTSTPWRRSPRSSASDSLGYLSLRDVVKLADNTEEGFAPPASAAAYPTCHPQRRRQGPL